MQQEEQSLQPEEPSPETEETQAEETPTQDVESLKRALEEERAKAERYLANWQRAQADFSNYKRRTDQERSESAQFANAMLILHLLPVLDDLERALNTVSVELAGFTWLDGIRLIQRKLQAVLEAHGVTEIPVVSQEFDPALHEAVMYAEGEEGKVIAELQRGYRLHDRVIRPTLVTVGKSKPEPAAGEETESAEKAEGNPSEGESKEE